MGEELWPKSVQPLWRGAVCHSPKLVLDVGVMKILPHREACKLTNLIMSSFLLFLATLGGLWDLSCPMRD